MVLLLGPLGLIKVCTIGLLLQTSVFIAELLI